MSKRDKRWTPDKRKFVRRLERVATIHREALRALADDATYVVDDGDDRDIPEITSMPRRLVRDAEGRLPVARARIEHALMNP